MISVKRFLFLLPFLTLLQLSAACGEATFARPIVANTANNASSQGKSTSPATAFSQYGDCTDFINENPQRVQCGFIDLPVDHNDPSKGTVTLPMLIAGQTRSLTSEAADKAILVPGGGGPGATIGFGLSYQSDEYLGIYQSLRSAGFDLIILDQRGAGFAQPTLKCPETAAAFKDSVNEKQTFIESLQTYRASLDACRTRLLSDDVPLQYFDTNQSARDFLAVMEQLPYQWWGVLATSYATVIAQQMELISPSVFDRIVLDSPVAIDYQEPFTFELTRSSIEKILSVCEITQRCDRKYPEIKRKLQEVLVRYKKDPVSLEIDITESNRTTQTTLKIDDNTLLDMLLLSAYSNYGITEVPWIVANLHDGKLQGLTQLATEYWHYNSDLDFSSALSWTIHCKERQPMEEAFLRSNPDSYNQYSDVSKIALDQERLVCADWNDKTPGTQAQNKLIATQTLIVAGDLDPVISQDDINNTADDFINKQLMILPGAGHSVWFQSACTRQNVAAFFLNNQPALPECRDGLSRFR